MKCIECGHELKDGAVFCIRCGAMQVSKNGEAAEANKAPVRPSASSNTGGAARHTTTAGKSFKPTPRRNPASIVVPIVAAVAVVAAAIGVGVFVLKPGDSGQSASSNASAATQVVSTSSESASASSTSASSAASSASSTSASSKSSTSSSKTSTSTTTSTSNTNNTSTNTNNNTTTQQQTYVEPEPEPEPEPTYNEADTYYAPDTSERYYSYEELSNWSDYDLYFARNEIFARHGRMFDNADLQDYFNSKSWYTPTYTPEQWESMASPLSDVEQKNTEAMIAVEKDRNSPYI